MAKMKDSGVEWIGEIPEGWEGRRIKYLYETNKAKLPKELSDDKTLIPYLSMDYIRDDSIEPQYAKDGDFCSKKDLLLLWDGSNAGEIIFDHPEGYAPSTTAILKKLNNDSIDNFDKYFLKAFEDELRKTTNGMGIPHVDGYYFRNSFFLIPPKEIQQKIATYLDEKCSQIEQTIQSQQQVIEKLKAYKQSLITEAVTGKVKIQNGKVAGKYEQYKDSGVEWIGEIPSGWKAVKFKYLGKFIGGYAFPSTEFSDTGIKVIKIANIQPMKVSWEEKSFVTEKYKDLSDYQVCKGDLIFALTRPIINGGIKTAIFDEDDFVLLNQRNAMFKGGKSITSKWQFYLMQHKNFIQEFEKYIDGTGQQPNISTFEIQNIAIPLPEIKEQNEIAEYLDKTCATIDSAIEQKQKLIEKLTEYKKSLIYECVTGKREVKS